MWIEFHGIFNFSILVTIIFNFAWWIHLRKLISTLYIFYVSFTNLFVLSIFALYHFTVLLITHYSLRITIQNLISMLIETYFDQNVPWNFSRVPWNFLNNVWTAHMVPWNSMELKQQNLKFRGIPWSFVQIQSSMVFHWTFSMLPSSMEFRGRPWNL